MHLLYVYVVFICYVVIWIIIYKDICIILCYMLYVIHNVLTRLHIIRPSALIWGFVTDLRVLVPANRAMKVCTYNTCTCVKIYRWIFMYM